MDSRPFYAPQETHNPLRWILPVTRALCIGTAPRSFLFGGVGLGAAVTALETATGRPLIWATAQYLAYAEPNSTLDIDVDPVVEGNTVTQARVMGHVGGREILTVNAALGARDEFSPRQFAEIPVVPSPREAEGAPLSYEEDADLYNRFEIRPIQRLPGEDEGRARMWIRSREGEPLTAGLLAVIADYIPAAVSAALDLPVETLSLDNTLRLIRVQPTDWVLCDMQVFGIASGVMHGRMHLFSRDGLLLGTASQSGIVYGG